MEAVDGANVNAVGIFTFNTVLGDYKGHIGYQLMLIKIAYLKWANHIRKQVPNESLEIINAFYKISLNKCLKTTNLYMLLSRNRFGLVFTGRDWFAPFVLRNLSAWLKLRRMSIEQLSL